MKALTKSIKDTKENQSVQELFPLVKTQKATSKLNTPKKEIIPSGSVRNMERQGRSARKIYYEENIEEDGDDGSVNIKINKIPQRVRTISVSFLMT